MSTPRFGRKTAPTRFNVLRDGAAKCAEGVVGRLRSRSVSLDVTVDDQGYMRTDDATAHVPRPKDWIVGRFTPSRAGFDVEHIAEALQERANELRSAA